MSEGRDRTAVEAIARPADRWLLDVHVDPDHHRSVLTLAGSLSDVETATRAVAATTVGLIDLRRHEGVHPRLGALDVVPVVPLAGDERAWAAAAATRDRLAGWIGAELGVPCFLYGPERSLPEVRRSAFRGLRPDAGPERPHPTAGATAVGVRPPLVAYNLWLVDAAPRATPAAPPDGRARAVAVARSLAADLRGPSVRALGLPVRGGAQVSCNLLAPTGPAIVGLYDAVAAGAARGGCRVERAELVGLIPRSALDGVPEERWPQLDLAPETTIESRWHG